MFIFNVDGVEYLKLICGCGFVTINTVVYAIATYNNVEFT